MRTRIDGNEYLKKYPRLTKWMNQCICCGKVGYKSEFPQYTTSSDGTGEFKTCSADHIRSMFSMLEVNELGMCQVCQSVQERKCVR